MNKICPQDGLTPLIIIERNGIEIDYCPACRGVWLDRGELEKLMDSAAQMAALGAQNQARPQTPQPDPLMPPASAYPQQPGYSQQPPPPAYGAQQPYGYNGSGGYKHGKKRKGFLADIFDFD